MKNTDPPPRTAKPVSLTPELRKFIEGVGRYFENAGIPRIGGLILGLLMISHEPLSADDIISILKVSRGSISTNMRILIGSGLVEKVTPIGHRTSYYVYPESALERRTELGIESGVNFKKLSMQGLAALPPDDKARHRLEDTIEWSDVLIDAFQKVLTDWNQRRRSQQLSSKAAEPARRLTSAVPQKN